MWPAVPMMIDGMDGRNFVFCTLYFVLSALSLVLSSLVSVSELDCKLKQQSTKHQVQSSAVHHFTISKSIHCVATLGFSFTRSLTMICNTYSPGAIALPSSIPPTTLSRFRSACSVAS